MRDPELDLREELLRQARRMLAGGLVTGTSGNLSARPPSAGWCLVTPSGVDYLAMRPEDLVMLDLEGKLLHQGMKPSVDAPIHIAVYRARADVGAVIHTHSPYAAAFSTLHREIPPLITESAGFLGGGVRVLEYVPPARVDTGDRVATGLGNDRAVLLPNHGVVAVGEDLHSCYAAAAQVEEMARIAFLALQLGEPRQVPRSEIERLHQFIHHDYGQR
ncbi:MAG TPA: class II aldolase/adducin family protein [Candidatus Dormibacteraeota bacterium]|nr:class II aldolase/adducin family protein [Candidatus Dormibacteraeota bacterium]